MAHTPTDDPTTRDRAASGDHLSGEGRASQPPAEIGRLNWGALVLGWVWAIGNRAGLATILLALFVPFYTVYLLFKGNEIAWRSKPWGSIAEFRQTQRRWAIAGLAYLGGVSLLVCGLGLLGSILSTGGAAAGRPPRTAVAGAGGVATGAAVPAPRPTPTIAPTPTERPAPTPRPSPTPRPPTPTPTAPPTPVTAKLGEQATGQGFALTVHEVRDPVPPQRYRQPKEGTRWIAVDVTVRNIGTAELSYNPFYAKLKAADNREYSATVGVAEPDLGAGKQQPGDATRGWITFELPADAQPALLVYTPDFGRNRVQFDLRP